MAESADPAGAQRSTGTIDRTYRLLQAALLGLRAGPALILFLLIIVVSLTTPIFFTSRNLGNGPRFNLGGWKVSRQVRGKPTYQD